MTQPGSFPPHHGSSTSLLTSAQPLSRDLRKQIQSGEYVAFEDILNEVTLGPPPANTSERRRSRHRSSADRPVTPISTLADWLQAWTAYAATITEVYPSRCSEILGYQAIIANTAVDYRPEFRLEYDRRFRWRAAHDGTLRWDRIDARTWSACMINQQSGTPAREPQGSTPSRSSTTFSCFACREPGHVASVCPHFFRGSNAAESTRGPITGPKHEPGRRSAPIPICIKYNRGTCIEPSICRYRHICSRSG